jgi:phosphoglycolate phosphatase-like HAD superfamily hydrolase
VSDATPRGDWRPSRRALLEGAAALALAGCTSGATFEPDPLPSWNDGANKRAILKFIADVTRAGGSSFVQAEERIAVFDNDGTLWVEQPMYVQFVFMLEQVKAAAPRHPEWKDNPVFVAIAQDDHQALQRLGDKQVLGFVTSANAGMTDEAYDQSIRTWTSRARHPRFDRLYTELVYQPQLELLGYLRRNGFKTYIVSGGSAEFVRAFAERVYGIPPEQVVGTQNAMQFGFDGGRPSLVRLPAIEFVDDGPGKPVGIYKHIGRRPILAFGNSDGDWQMLQYTMAGPGSRMALLVHHDDAEREFAYDRQSSIGRLDKAWDDAVAKGWNVVSMRRDWKIVFSPR